MAIICAICSSAPATVRRSHLPPQQNAVCSNCFVRVFEDEVHRFIVAERLFTPGDVVAIGVSGGKDSAVLLHLLYELNRRHDYGVHLVMVAVDEGIVGYRDHSLEAVDEQQRRYNLPLRILSYDRLYSGWTMDRVVETIGKRGNCTYCGVFRRQALEKGAAMAGATKLATGHNADDVAETILMNLLRGDLARLQRCVKPLGKGGPDENVPRVKPLFRCYEKEIVLYARFLNLRYFATECLYAPNAYRGHVRTLIKQMERVRARSILDILQSGRRLAAVCSTIGGRTLKLDNQQQQNSADRIDRSNSCNRSAPTIAFCQRCGNVSSRELCHACALLDQLEAFQLRPREIFIAKVEHPKPEDDDESPLLPIEDLVPSRNNALSTVGGDRSSNGCACSNSRL